MMEDRIIVTKNDYERLMGLLGFSSIKSESKHVADRLSRNLQAARKMNQENIDRTVVTMNSRVKLKDTASKRAMEITITYPQDAEPQERRVSIISEIGLALFGRRKKDLVSWRVPNGVGHFEIAEVTYQPEASGHYYL
ncbi:MAG TPA: GreA/GreB family elongation factor [Cyclobacteriaceae bacterium]|nr:GreA/GreB family elongation factor [Cyclobacteriaceae bacterium]HNI14989.1 GreA/GreB family elongation factor [Cyclobacteriaceae bacterium]HNK25106.1 GreA/GreB family elongation factor [Cyclobacteriaceae bacterium]